MKIKLTDLKIGDRIRKDLGDINELAASLARLGQLQPIIVDDDNQLIAGGRRTAAATLLGWDEIEAKLYKDCDELLRKDIELEENLKRKALEWPEEVLAIKGIYDLRVARFGEASPGRRSILDGLDGSSHGYSMGDAAEDLERSKASISMDLALARALIEMPGIALEASKAAAWKRFKRSKETEIRSAQAARTRIEDLNIYQPDAENDPDEHVHTEPSQPPKQPIKRIGWKGKGMLYLADSLDVLRYMPKESIDCIVTDPPYGIDLYREGQETSGNRLAQQAGTMYDDDPFKVMNTLDQVFMHAAELLKPNGHAYVFFHMTRYEETYLMLRKHFGTCEETPIIWIKNTPGIGDPNRSWVYAYEPCFFINRGRHLHKPQAFNYLQYNTIPAAHKIHPTEKPAALLRHLIQASCLPNETVLDPFAGSGSTLAAAAQLGCKFIGIEKHEPFHRSAVERVAEVLGGMEELAAEIPLEITP